MERADLEDLERRLRALPEPAMRRELALEALEKRPPDAAYALLAAAVGRPDREPPGLLELRRALHEVLAQGGAARPLAYELRASLYAEAARADDAFVMRLLRTPPAAESMEDPGRALPREIADIPLGVRRSLARGLDRELLDRLLRDPDPVVMDHLLDNGRVTEDHVVRIAARRPIPETTLVRIHRSRRFGPRPRVRLAIARNPYCPTDLAIELLASLDATALREIAADGTLHGEVRQHAADELARRETGD